MKDIYVSLSDASILERLPYKSLAKRIERNLKDFRLKIEPNSNGGKNRVLVSINSLSKQARQRYRAEIRKNQAPTNDIPWYVYVDLNWYKQNYSNHFFEAVEIARYIEKYINSEIKMTELTEKVNMSPRNIRRYVKDYTEACVWADDEELRTGDDYSHIKILAVSRKPKEDKTFPSITDEMSAYIDNIYYNKNFALNNNPLTNLYEDLQDIAEIKQWKMPSYDTVLRYVNYIKEQDGKGTRELACKGLRYWKNRYMMKRYRDTKALQVLEVVQGDVHTFDCWVSVKRANGTLDAIRPALVAWIDMRSRALVGWVITECPDADIMKQSLINVMYPKANKELPYGVPKYLLIDNGKEYTARCLTGRARTERVCFDDEAKGFYREMGIIDDIRSLPFQPWSKAQIERYFGTVELKFGKKINSYTGTLTGSRTEAKVNKDIKKMLENGELPTINDFAKQFEQWVVTKFHTRKHKGLIEQGEEAPIPIDVFNNSDTYFKPAPPLDYAISRLMKAEIRVVTQMGVQRTIEGKAIYYTNKDLVDKYKGDKVVIRYYPQDITSIIVYNKDGKQICKATSYELLHIAPKLSEDALIEHIKDQKRQQNNARDTIKYRKMTYEQRQELELEQAGKKVIAPELDPTAIKVTAIVTDEMYIEDKKIEKSEKPKSKQAITHNTIKNNSENIENEYLNRKAKEAFEEMKKLG